MLIVAIILAVAVGLATAAQSPTNAALGQIVGPVQASFVSFSGGLLVLGLLCPFVGSGDLTQVVSAPPWMLLGGVYGAFIVFVMALCAPRLGVALTLTLFMLGQLGGGLVVDTLGLLEVAPVPLSPLRVVGCLLAFAGIACVYVGRIRYSSAVKSVSVKKRAKESGGSASVAAPAPTAAASGNVENASKLVIAAVLCFSAGAISAVQTPTNAAIGAIVGTLEASVVSFAGGWISLLVVMLFLAATGRGGFKSLKGAAPWKMTGGLYGAFGVPALIVATPVLGVSLSMAGLMFGQLVGGMVVDATGMFGVLRMRADGFRLGGAALLLVGVALVTVAKMGL